MPTFRSEVRGAITTVEADEAPDETFKEVVAIEETDDGEPDGGADEDGGDTAKAEETN